MAGDVAERSYGLDDSVRPVLNHGGASGKADEEADEGTDLQPKMTLRSPSTLWTEDEEKPADDQPTFVAMLVMARIKNHHLFEPVCMSAIALNAIWIGIDTDIDISREIVDAVGISFCIFFTGEILVRWLAYTRLVDFFVKPTDWQSNMFDLILLLVMLFETLIVGLIWGGESNLPGLQTIRLLRLTRLLRLLRSFPEMMIMVKSLVAALLSVALTFTMVIGLMYVFAVTFTVWSQSHEQKYPCDGLTCTEAAFGTIPRSYMTLTQILCFDNTYSIVRATFNEDSLYGFMLIAFITIGGFTLLNVLIGIICEIVSHTSAVQREQLAQEAMESALANLDTQNDLSDKEIDRLSKIGIDEDTCNFAHHMLTYEGGEITKSRYLKTLNKLMHKPEAHDVALVERKLELLRETCIDQAKRKRQRKADEEKVWIKQAAEIEERIQIFERHIEEKEEAVKMVDDPMDDQMAAFEAKLLHLDGGMQRLADALAKTCQDGPALRSTTADSTVHWRNDAKEVLDSMAAASFHVAHLAFHVPPARREAVDMLGPQLSPRTDMLGDCSNRFTPDKDPIVSPLQLSDLGEIVMM